MSVRGKVVDENGEPLIGASVLVKGTQNGQITNLEGVFSFANLKKNRRSGHLVRGNAEDRSSRQTPDDHHPAHRR